MKYMDIYNGVTNPLDEDRVLDILAQASSSVFTSGTVFK